MLSVVQFELLSESLGFEESGMLSGLDTIEILTEYENPARPTTMEAEVMSMPVGFSSISKWKQ